MIMLAGVAAVCRRSVTNSAQENYHPARQPPTEPRHDLPRSHPQVRVHGALSGSDRDRKKLAAS